jgi:negative regulator of sigma E activity
MMHFDESMDRTIDEVARAMTAAPSPALEARVAARLRPRPSRRASWLAPAAVMLATASVALLVVIQSRPATVRPPAATSSPLPRTSVAALVPLPQANGPEASRAAKRRVDATATERSGAEAGSERAVPALPTIDDLSIAPIQPTALVIPQLRVIPIGEMAPLAVVAIDGVDRDR